MASASASSGFKAQAKNFFNVFGPPLAGVSVGWGLWGAGEYVAPDQMHSAAMTIHNSTYYGQEWLTDNVIPSAVAEGLANMGLVIPPPLSVLEKDRDEENDAQSATMFREIFEQCRMQEGMDWLEENVTEEIPFIYINELFASWGSAFFWKHFLRKQHKKRDPQSETGMETTPSQDLKSLEKRIERDIGECDVHVKFQVPKNKNTNSSNGDDDTKKQQEGQENEEEGEQEMMTKIKIKPGGEASFIEGVWYRFAVLGQLDSAAGWSTLAVLTQNKQNALALAKIALVADSLSNDDFSDNNNNNNNNNNQVSAGDSTFYDRKMSLLLGGDETKTKEKSISLLCDADRCLWSLASLMKVGLKMWKKKCEDTENNDGSSAAMTSAAGSSNKPYLVATASISEKDEEKERKRKLRKERATGKQNPYAEEEAEEGGSFREEKENREFMRLVMNKLDELNIKQRQQQQQQQNNNNDDHDNDQNHQSWELETERRWAIAGADPFLVTLRNVDSALCDYLRKGEDQATISHWYDFLGFGGSKASRCPSLTEHQRKQKQVGEAEKSPSQVVDECTNNNKEIVKFISSSSSSSSNTKSSLVPILLRQFSDSPHFFNTMNNNNSNDGAKKKESILGEYIGKQFSGAASAGEVPFSSPSSTPSTTPPAILKNFNLNDDELIAAAGFLKKQSGVVKSWVHQ